MRVNVYIDGFNLYYGLVKGTPHKWLNLSKLCTFLLSGEGHRVNRIRYFTALIQARDDPQQPQRQQAYVRALATIPNLTIHFGSFITKAVRLPLQVPVPGGPRTASVLRTEEKGSDVNLATYLLVDAFDGDYEMAVVISNDSDLAEPIRMVRSRFALPVGVFCPHKQMSWDLGQVASFQRPIRQRVLPHCQFPPLLRDAQGPINKPASW